MWYLYIGDVGFHVRYWHSVGILEHQTDAANIPFSQIGNESPMVSIPITEVEMSTKKDAMHEHQRP